MLVEIFRRTPAWVFLLFAALLASGYAQSRNRRLSPARVAMLPAVMAGLSFYGVFSTFGFAPQALVCWLLGIAVAVLAGASLAPLRGVSWSAEARQFEIPGSWLPLSLMMAIFGTKYAVGVVLARQLPFGGDLLFADLVSLAYGFFSGVFLTRARLILKAARQ